MMTSHKCKILAGLDMHFLYVFENIFIAKLTRTSSNGRAFAKPATQQLTIAAPCTSYGCPIEKWENIAQLMARRRKINRKQLLKVRRKTKTLADRIEQFRMPVSNRQETYDTNERATMQHQPYGDEE